MAGNILRRLPATRLAPVVLAAALLLVAPASGIAKPPPRESATPDQLREYVSSGAYLADVRAAVAPAKAFLAARMDEVDSQRSACTAAGLALGTGAVAPAAATPTPATPATGSAKLLLRKSLFGGSRVKVTATGATVSGARSLALRVSAAKLTTSSARLTSGATVVLARGGKRVTLRSLEIVLTRKSVSVTALLGARRVTVLRSVAGKRQPALSATKGSALALPLRLTRAAATTLRRVGLPATARAGVVTAKVKRAAATTPAFTATAASCASVPSKPAMVLDIDETALSAYLAGGDPGGGTAGQAPELFGTAVALPPVLDLFDYARSRGVAVDFITARITPQAINTGSNLDAQGYGDRVGVTFRSSTSDDAGQYKHDARQALQDKQGYTILANVGDQCSDLYDGQAERSFKLPNTFYYTAGKQDASCDPDN